MRIRLVAVGKLRNRSIASLCAEYEKRLRPYHRLDLIEVAAGHGARPDKTAADEAESILRRAADGPVWLLDAAGSELSSEELSTKISALENEGVQPLTLIIGGTFGVGAAVRERADFRWSLSKLTFLHEWTRAIVLEQLYRAAKIARGEPYHH